MLRYDSFKVSLRGLEPDKNGFLNIAKAYPTKAGVLVYKTADGKEIRELRSPEEVFREDSMQSLAMKPFSIEHRGGILTPENVKDQNAGATGQNIGRDGDFMTCSIAVFRSDAINQIIKEGVMELSAGYTCDTIESPGVYKGQRYDRVQTNIRYNHLTLTRKARGEGCRIRLDSGDAILAEEGETQNNQDNEEQIMKVVKLKIPAIQVGEMKFDSETIEVEETQSRVIEDLIARQELMAAESAKRDARLDSLTKELAEEKEKSGAFTGYISPDQLDKHVAERAELLAAAKEFKMDSAGMDTKAIKLGLCKAVKRFDEARLDSDQAYLDAAWDQTKGTLKKPNQDKEQIIKPFSVEDVAKGEEQYL
jgi:hypothetical protein